jgi:hypothetical protein
MQCYCEPEPQYAPATCALDGQDCLCDGVVFYMKRLDEKIRHPGDFWDAMNHPYTLN